MIQIEAAALTDPGIVRDSNEDQIWTRVCNVSDSESAGLFIVCDGMGGHLGGEYASFWAVETIKKELSGLFTQKDPRATVLLSADDQDSSRTKTVPSNKEQRIENIAPRVKKAIENANQVVKEYALRKPQEAKDAGTTITMAVVWGDKAVIANVGDSRTYLLRDHKLRQVTDDHSLVGSMVKGGLIAPQDVYTHPQRNVILRCVGQGNSLEVDTFNETLKSGDYLLLCSDGLWEMIRDEATIVKIIESSSGQRQACQRLIDAAKAAGGEDNISVIVVELC